MRIGPLLIDANDGAASTWIRGRWYRRCWWRIWIEQPRPTAPYATTIWIARRLSRVLARFVVHEGGTIAAAEAMRALNRYAKLAGGKQWEIYSLKTQLIAALYEQFPCTVTKAVNRSSCWSCYGTGEWVSESGRYTDVCYKCRGTGIYAEHELLYFVFRIGNREFHFHQPAEKWPKVASSIDGEVELYKPVARDAIAKDLSLLEYERLAETVALYVDMAGLALDMRVRSYPSLWTAIAGDIRGEVRSLSRWYRATKTSFVHYFAGSEDPDADLPF